MRKKQQTKEERERRFAVKGAAIVGLRTREKVFKEKKKKKKRKKKRVRNRREKNKKEDIPIDLFNTDRWFFGQGLQVVSPLEDAKQQAMIAVLQQPANSRVPRGAT